MEMRIELHFSAESLQRIKEHNGTELITDDFPVGLHPRHSQRPPPRSPGNVDVAKRSNNWMVRANAILKFGESKTFEPLDREAHTRESNPNSLAHALDEFARLRAENLTELRALNLQPADLARRGRHPAFGPVTLSQLLATWATHDLTHLHQLSRVLAHQYREAVGPWSVYLGVLKCDAHSSAA
jgi:hypothetical protein